MARRRLELRQAPGSAHLVLHGVARGTQTGRVVSEASQSKRRHHELGEVAALFLKLGVIGFGGPAAHIALMRQEVVARRKWVTEQEFLDLVGAANLIPGPSSTE